MVYRRLPGWEGSVSKRWGIAVLLGDFVYRDVCYARSFSVLVECDDRPGRIGRALDRVYFGRGEVEWPPYNPVPLKLLGIDFLSNLLERRVGMDVSDSPAVRWFLGLAVYEAVPDNARLSAFKDRIAAQEQAG